MTPLPSPVLCPRCNGRSLTCLHCEGDRFVWAREALTMRRPMVLRKGISPRRPVSPSKPPLVQAPGEVVELGALERSPAAGTQPAPVVYPRGATLWPPVRR